MNKAQLQKFLILVTVLYCVGVGIYAFNHGMQGQSDDAHGGQTMPPSAPSAATLLPVGTEAPDFTLTSIEGKSVTLSQYRHHQWVLLEFFASWCPHCQHSAPHLQALQKEYPHKLKILAVNSGDHPPKASTAQAFHDTYKVTYTILDYPDPSLMKSYDVSGIPTLYLVDEAGKIAWSTVGTLSDQSIADFKKHFTPAS
jgi:thiol-disulfide isomerase/thioredoxin